MLAPTGTIGLLMDCDTTGIEPDFALVKFKKLAGGGYFKIVNQSVPEALRRLGYREYEVQDIVAYVSGTNTLLAAPQVNRATLKDRGLSSEDLAKIEAAIPGVFDLRSSPSLRGSSAKSPTIASASPRTRERAGLQPLLRHLGFSKAQIEEANETIVGRMTVEGAPHLRLEHYAVFDCANRCGKHGKRFLAPMSHIQMMAAVQPFLSGAISKTVNLPNEATVDEIADLYYQGWKLGLKAVALYRDGCKASQPLSTSSEERRRRRKSRAKEAPCCAAAPIETRPASPPVTGVVVRLPKKRTGFTQEARVGGHKIFLRTGHYEDGSNSARSSSTCTRRARPSAP